LSSILLCCWRVCGVLKCSVRKFRLGIGSVNCTLGMCDTANWLVVWYFTGFTFTIYLL
jgi:hypothetical protein